MNLKTLSMMGALLLLAGTGANAQKKKEVLNDSNTPLHLLQPAYKVPYGMLTTEEIKADMDRVLRYLEKNTPTRVVDKNTGKVITDYANMTADAQLERGAFRLASYEWGVTYSAMLAAAEATGDQAYYKYVTDRFQFLASATTSKYCPTSSFKNSRTSLSSSIISTFRLLSGADGSSTSPSCADISPARTAA